MKFAVLASLSLATASLAEPAGKLRDFELTDQHGNARSFRFPRSKVTVMTVADHKGSDQLAPWIQRIYDRYENRIEIGGVADVSMIAAPFQGLFRSAFRQQLTYPVMLDWRGEVVKQFAPEKGVANLYVIDRDGRIVSRVSGPLNGAALDEFTREIDRARRADGR